MNTNQTDQNVAKWRPDLFMALAPAILLLAFSASAATASEASFHVGGRTEYRVFKDGAVRLAATNHFRVAVRGCASEIETTDVALAGSVKVESYQYRSDGTSSCLITWFAENSLADAKPRAAGLPTRAFADLRSDVFPPTHTGFIGPVWLAYASRCALRETGSGKIPPLIFMGPGWSEYGNALSASWVSSANFPHVPEQVVEYADESVFLFTDALFRELRGLALPSLYKQGHTNAVYQVLVWTNIGGLYLPLHSRITKYRPKPAGQNAGDLEIQLTYDTFADKVIAAAVTPVSIPDTLPGRTRVTDYRFGKPDEPPAIYFTGSGEILSQQQIGKMRSPVRSRPVWVIYAFFGLTLTLPLAGLALLIRRRKGL